MIPKDLWVELGRLFRGVNAAAIPPYMEANIQRGIIDTSQLQSPTTAVAQWGDVLKNCSRDNVLAMKATADRMLLKGLVQLLKPGNAIGILCIAIINK